MTTTSENERDARSASSGAEWEGEVESDPTGQSAPFPGESRAQACRRWALEDEIEEDPVQASRESQMIRALRDEELFAAELSRKAIVSLPTAVRQLYRRNPSNPRVRQLYDQLTAELYARADDVLRTNLLDSVEEIVSLMDCGDPAIRLRAATYVFERLRGKTPEVLNVTQDKPFQVVLERLVTGPRPGAELAAAASGGSNGPEDAIDAEIVAETNSAPGTEVVKAERPKARPARKPPRRKTAG